jgi:hypothetical protein
MGAAAAGSECRSEQSEKLLKSATYCNARGLVAPYRNGGPELGWERLQITTQRGRRCQQRLDCIVSAMQRYVKVYCLTCGPLRIALGGAQPSGLGQTRPQ